MKFLWESNAPWAGTGYGQQTKLLLHALHEATTHEPTCFCFYGLNGGSIEYDGYQCLPNSDYETWGNDVIKAHIERSRAEAVVTLMDLFVLDTTIWDKLDVPWLAWVPIDSEGLGDVTLDRLKIVNYPIPMSHFGAMQMQDHDVEPSTVIYHAVDTDVFVPLDKDESRDLLGLDPDAFVVGMVMANKSDRKQYPLQLEAVKIWADKNPDVKVQVYLHTEPTAAMGGWDMRSLAKRVGLSGRVFSTNQYDTSVVPMNSSMMARIFNSFDVLMNASSGEGFGIPIVEAQACGVPVITHNVTAMPELTHYGYCVESAGKGLGGHYGWMYSPDLEDLVYRIDCVYRMANKTSGLAARQWVIQNCSIPIIAAQWAALLDYVEETLDEIKTSGRVSLR